MSIAPMVWALVPRMFPTPFSYFLPNLQRPWSHHYLQMCAQYVEVYVEVSTWVWAWKSECEQEGVWSKNRSKKPDQGEYLEEASELCKSPAWAIWDSIPHCAIFLLLAPIASVREDGGGRYAVKEKKESIKSESLGEKRPSEESYLQVTVLGTQKGTLYELFAKG